ncbi:MAG: hypothetical protein QM770_20900 [Tepidisphaeraceae bacterium]
MAEKPKNESLPAGPNANQPAGAQQQPPPKTDLEVFLFYTLPNFLKKRFDYFLFGLVILAAGYWYWNYRQTSATQERYALQQNAATIWEMLETGKRSVLSRPSSSESDVRTRVEMSNQIESIVNQILGSTAAPEQKVQALLVRANLNMALAQLPASSWANASTIVPGTTTKPSSDYLADAERAYNAILTDYDKQSAQVMPALLGLASIAETRGDLTKAESYYDMVLKDANARPDVKQLATARKQILPELKTPLAVPIASTTTRPASTMPATTEPALAPKRPPPLRRPAPCPEPIRSVYSQVSHL